MKKSNKTKTATFLNTSSAIRLYELKKDYYTHFYTNPDPYIRKVLLNLLAHFKVKLKGLYRVD